MDHPNNWLDSAPHLATSLLVAAVAFVMLTQRVASGGPRAPWSAVWRRDDGASYSLSLVITLPLYVALICAIVETALLLTAKIGTVYAVYAAARAASVWEPAECSPAIRQLKIKQAAVDALTPFAPSFGSGAAPATDFRGERLAAAYRRYVQAPRVSDEFLRRKRAYAEDAVQVTVERSDSHSDLVVTLIYDAPLHTPVFRRLLADNSAGSGAPRHTRRIRTTLRISPETPLSSDGRLGIRYDSTH